MKHSPSKHKSGGAGKTAGTGDGSGRTGQAGAGRSGSGAEKAARSGNKSTKDESRSDEDDAPIRRANDVEESNDEHIDQDFPGYPHHPSHDRTIHNGSAGAFDATEHSHDEEDDDQDSDDFAMDR